MAQSRMPNHTPNRRAPVIVLATSPKRSERGGRLKIPNTRLAKDMGRTLVNAGFRLVYDQPHAGDVAVIQNIVGHDSGHVCIYDGQQWISGFVQRTLYPGQAYRNIQPHYELFRHD